MSIVSCPLSVVGCPQQQLTTDDGPLTHPMLRSLFLALATLAIITVAFLWYWRSQPNTAMSGPVAPPSNPTTAPTDQMQYSIGSIGRGERAWVNSFDDKGRRASQFHAD